MPTRPNIVLVTVHDLGTMLGCYGADPVLRTPHLDRLAASGVRFDNHFATAAFCSPSRGGIATGKVPHVNGLMGLVNLGWDMPRSCVTIGHHMRRAGYHTALVGLQHETTDPSRLGFDDLLCDGAHTSGAVVERAADWLAAQRPHDQPFFLQMGFSDVHRAFPERGLRGANLGAIRPLPYLDDSPGLREDLWEFYGLVEEMDANVGALMQCLDRNGLEENTLLVFTTDHGIAFPRAKATLYDPGIHTALIMRGPAGCQGGRVCTELLSNVDLLPTLLEAAGASPPDGLQGRSFMPLLKGQPYVEREFIFAETNTTPWNTARCIRTRTHKLIRTADPGPLWHLPSDIERSKTRRDMGEAPLWERCPVEFYDLQADPCEKVNRSGEPGCAGAEAHCLALLRAFQEETHDPVLQGPIKRPAGEAAILRDIFEKIPGAQHPATGRPPAATRRTGTPT